MTDLDLICEEPIKIGLLGTICFISFSIGSILLTNQADIRGRKTTTLTTGYITAICIMLFIYLELNLQIIYILIFIYGCVYNVRSSVAYLHNSELLESHARMNMGTCIFSFSGLLQAFSAYWFWYTKDQTTYLTLLAIVLFSALTCLTFFIPESPVYLLERQNFSELRQCLLTIGSFNKV